MKRPSENARWRVRRPGIARRCPSPMPVQTPKNTIAALCAFACFDEAHTASVSPLCRLVSPYPKSIVPSPKVPKVPLATFQRSHRSDGTCGTNGTFETNGTVGLMGQWGLMRDLGIRLVHSEAHIHHRCHVLFDRRRIKDAVIGHVG